MLRLCCLPRRRALDVDHRAEVYRESLSEIQLGWNLESVVDVAGTGALYDERRYPVSASKKVAGWILWCSGRVSKEGGSSIFFLDVEGVVIGDRDRSMIREGSSPYTAGGCVRIDVWAGWSEMADSWSLSLFETTHLGGRGRPDNPILKGIHSLDSNVTCYRSLIRFANKGLSSGKG